jgi:tRNA uridine 5-carboxymethylaminomethyl modification enzyme
LAVEKARISLDGDTIPAAQYLRRPEISMRDLSAVESLSGELRQLILDYPEAAFQAELEVKYDGYLIRQQTQVEAFRKMEAVKLPQALAYRDISALSAEARTVLEQKRPATLGQASRMPGVRASDVAVIMVMLKRF